jgi:hypothetical protein
MAVTEAYPTLNGMAPSWADVSATITGEDVATLETADFAAINHSSLVEEGKQRGASGGRVLRRTTGSLTDEASITYYKTGLMSLIRALKANAPSRGNQKMISLVFFDVLIQQTPPGTTEIYTVKFKGCRILGDTAAMAEGVEADQIEVPMSPGQIVRIVDGEEIVLL